MIAVQQLNILYGIQCLLFKVRIMFIAQEILLFFYKKPNAERGYVFNAYRNAFAMLQGFFLHLSCENRQERDTDKLAQQGHAKSQPRPRAQNLF